MESKEPRSNRSAKKIALPFGLMLVALLGLVFVQAIAAQDGPDLTPSPYVDRVDTAEELEAKERSIDTYVAGHAITDDQLLDADISTSSVEADRSEVPVGSTIMFTINVVNSGDEDASIEVVSPLPENVTFLSVDFGAPTNGLEVKAEYDEVAEEVLWNGVLGATGTVAIALQVQVNDDVAAGTEIMSSAEITSGEDSAMPSATVTVVENTGASAILPFITYGELPMVTPVELSATRPTSANKWTVTLTPETVGTDFELQVSQNPNFPTPTVINLGQTLSREFQPAASYNNVYYYRARSYSGDIMGPWSNTVRVVGSYYDDFDNPASGWDVVRTTYIEEVQAFYEIEPENDKSWLILRVEDSWDWGIASPLMPAPDLPYVIEYEAKPANLGNLVSMGAVFGGDYPGSQCPDKSSAAGWYEHGLCFNHFYDTNTIWYGKLKLLFERVDRLEWCPTCGGSPMKRLGDIDAEGAKDLNGVNYDGWNKYRIEVRADSIKVYAGKQGGELKLALTYDDTRWVNDPYFGVMATTDEYSNSTARFEYFSVRPLDQ